MARGINSAGRRWLGRGFLGRRVSGRAKKMNGSKMAPNRTMNHRGLRGEEDVTQGKIRYQGRVEMTRAIESSFKCLAKENLLSYIQNIIAISRLHWLMTSSTNFEN